MTDIPKALKYLNYNTIDWCLWVQ